MAQNIPVSEEDYKLTKIVVLFDNKGQLVRVIDRIGKPATDVDGKPAPAAAFGYTCEKKGSPGNCFWINGHLYCV
jgi:hypothetical protein